MKILEEIINEKIELSLEKVTEYLDSSVFFDESLFIKKLVDKDSLFVLNAIDNFSECGMSAETLVDKLLFFLREQLLALFGLRSERPLFEKEVLLELTEGLLKVKRELGDISGFEFLPLEIFVMRFCGNKISEGDKGSDKREMIEKRGGLEQKSSVGTTPLNRKSERKDVNDNQVLSGEIWKRILTQIGAVDISVEALLRAARPLKLEGGFLELGVYYSFHKLKLEESKHRQLLEEVCSDVFGQDIKVICSLVSPPKNNQVTSELVLEKNRSDDIIGVAKEIFGS